MIEELRHTIPGVSNGLQAGSSCCVNLESKKKKNGSKISGCHGKK